MQQRNDPVVIPSPGTTQMPVSSPTHYLYARVNDTSSTPVFLNCFPLDRECPSLRFQWKQGVLCCAFYPADGLDPYFREHLGPLSSVVLRGASLTLQGSLMADKGPERLP